MLQDKFGVIAKLTSSPRTLGRGVKACPLKCLVRRPSSKMTFSMLFNKNSAVGVSAPMRSIMVGLSSSSVLTRIFAGVVENVGSSIRKTREAALDLSIFLDEVFLFLGVFPSSNPCFFICAFVGEGPHSSAISAE